MPKVCLRANEIGANRAQAHAYRQACTPAFFHKALSELPNGLACFFKQGV
jgi:hypothetical protein